MSYERAMDLDPSPFSDLPLYGRYLIYKTQATERALREVLDWREWVKQLNAKEPDANT